MLQWLKCSLSFFCEWELETATVPRCAHPQGFVLRNILLERNVSFSCARQHIDTNACNFSNVECEYFSSKSLEKPWGKCCVGESIITCIWINLIKCSYWHSIRKLFWVWQNLATNAAYLFMPFLENWGEQIHCFLALLLSFFPPHRQNGFYQC